MWIVMKYFKFAFVLTTKRLSTLVAKHNSPLFSVAWQMLNVLFFLYAPHHWLQFHCRQGQLVSLLRLRIFVSDF